MDFITANVLEQNLHQLSFIQNSILKLSTAATVVILSLTALM
jgi:hypothetical protein